MATKSGAPKAPQVGRAREKLATMPLSVLLPQIGDLSSLSAASENLENRLQEVQSNDNDGGTQDDVRRRVGEEAMLLQVLNWLNVGRDREGS